MTLAHPAGAFQSHETTFLAVAAEETNARLLRHVRGETLKAVRSFSFATALVLQQTDEGSEMTVDSGRRRGALGGISLGGILVIVGIIVALAWSVVLGIIIAVIGLLAFGGFVRGKWY